MSGLIRCLVLVLAVVASPHVHALDGHIFVIGSRSPTNLGRDQPLIDAITGLGLTYTYNVSSAVQNASNPAALVEGHDMIFISESIGSPDGAGLNTAVGNLDIPLIHAESGINLEMGMAMETGGTFTITDITIIDDALPAANGLTGVVTIYPSPGEMVHGDPPATAHVVAECFNPAKDGMLPCVFYYDKGDTMLDRTAPNKRGFFLANQDGFGLLNEDGHKLFEGLMGYFLGQLPRTGVTPDSWSLYE